VLAVALLLARKRSRCGELLPGSRCEESMAATVTRVEGLGAAWMT